MGPLRARLVPYRLPLVRPWVAASAVIGERRGALLALTGDDRLTGWGDCAPLPSSGAAGCERTLAELAAFVASVARAPRPAADGITESMAEGIHSQEVRWAVETALADLHARRRGLPLAAFLGGTADRVAVNAALGPLDGGCGERAAAARAAGFAVAKVKVGLGTVADELAALRRLPGGLRLRLDANRAWNEADATWLLEGIADLPIDGVEEPLAEPTVPTLARLQARLPFPIAADESLPALGADALLDAAAVRRLVVKPARAGGIAATRVLAAKARAAGVELVLTSVVDSAVGVTAAAHLAAAVAPDMVHGLATSAWLAADVAPAPRLAEGWLWLGDGAGLGLSPSGNLG